MTAVQKGIKKPIYKQLFGAAKAKSKAGKPWAKEWEERINMLLESFPTGAGIDDDIDFAFDQVGRNSFVLEIPFHHMDQWGSYCGWSHTKVFVRASLQFDFDLIFLTDTDLLSEYYLEEGYFEDGHHDYLADILDEWLRKECRFVYDESTNETSLEFTQR